MPSVSLTYGNKPVTERQLARLFSIAYGGRGQPGALGGNKRERITQLFEMLQQFGYETWDAVDAHAAPEGWIRQRDYDELVSQLEVMRGGKL
jgi:hypothetical protein